MDRSAQATLFGWNRRGARCAHSSSPVGSTSASTSSTAAVPQGQSVVRTPRQGTQVGCRDAPAGAWPAGTSGARPTLCVSYLRRHNQGKLVHINGAC